MACRGHNPREIAPPSKYAATGTQIHNDSGSNKSKQIGICSDHTGSRNAFNEALE
jgi:hypothetical protein